LVVFGSFFGVVPNLALNKAVPHGFEQSCSAMATQKLEEKAQQHDEDAEWLSKRTFEASDFSQP